MKLSRRNLLLGAGAAAAATIPGVGAKEVARNQKWDKVADVVVLGYGGAGAAAAIEAFDKGAKVIILEKMAQGGGNTVVSAGQVVNVDDVEKAYGYFSKVWDLPKTPRDDSLLRAFCEEAKNNREFMMALKPDQNSYVYGHGSYGSVPGGDAISKIVFRAPRGANLGGGEVLFANYRYAVEEVRKIPVLLETPAKQLIVRGREVIGVEAESKGKTITIKAAKAVILTTGGFEYNDDMLANYCNGTGYHRMGNPGNTGDGVAMASAVGARLWHMNALSCPLGAVLPGKTASIQVNVLAPSHFFVDQYGKRFCNEKFEHHISINAVNFFDPSTLRFCRIPAYVIFDEEARKFGPLSSAGSGYALRREGYRWSKDNSAEIEAGIILKGDTIEELAQKINVPEKTLADTLKRWNTNIKKGADLDFGRAIEKKVSGNVMYDSPIVSRPLSKKGPYYALPIYPSMLNTQGGPKRNAKAQVVDYFEQPIPRLYVAGELGSIWGIVYDGGSNNGESLAFGRIAGRNAAAEKAW